MRHGDRKESEILGNDDDEDVAQSEQDGDVEHGPMLDVPPPPEPLTGTSEMRRPKIMRAPSAPSRQERAEHEIAHCPFRAWCEDCVAGKSHAKSHFSGQAGSPESDVPLVAFDYAFMSENGLPDSGKTEVDDEQSERDGQVKILVGRDRKSRCYVAIAVPSKGVDESEYATRRVLRFLDFLGCAKIIL